MLLEWPTTFTSRNLTALDVDSDVQFDASGAMYLEGSLVNMLGLSGGPYHHGYAVIVQNRKVVVFGRNAGSGAWALAGKIDLPASVGGDMEAIAHLDTDGTKFGCLNETDGKLATLQWLAGSTPVTYGPVPLCGAGSPMPPDVGGLGPEGLCFIRQADLLLTQFPMPSDLLPGQFLTCVGHQQGGLIHLFNHQRSNGQFPFTYYGAYKTGFTEVADLSFDRTRGAGYDAYSPGLFILHGGNRNTIERTDMSFTVEQNGQRTFRQQFEMKSPWYNSGTNLEGIAVNWEDREILFVIDTGGGTSVVLYENADFTPFILAAAPLPPVDPARAPSLSPGFDSNGTEAGSFPGPVN